MRRVDASTVAAAPLWATCTSPAGAEAARDTGAEEAARRDAEYKTMMDRGFQEGYAQGMAQAQEAARKQSMTWHQERESELNRVRAQYEQARKAFDELVGALGEQIRTEVAKAEELAVELTYSAVARLMGESYAAGALIPALVRHAMLEVDAGVETVLVSRQDAKMLEDIDELSVEVDSRLLPGQCRLRTRLGSYDTGLDVRMDMLRTALLTGLSEHRAVKGSA
ncbi:hypothetical protein CQ393_02335 [Stenotrophomonas sp. MYb238]|uniref:FliH/SctL family protein n=1 Tax=Stenotrophomonas sp. MYb238 TaxID=2040281 RepID=UPI00129093F9|nr:hypothetical protein [Stenotrophomonas sp. MYb238]MQP74730.1 hypothetical protein [Stenotrophomonas sp. MYb238]